MKKKLISFSIFILSTLSACSRYSTDTSDLVGTWRSDVFENNTMVLNEDGSGERWRAHIHTHDVEWTYLGDGHIRLLFNGVHLSAQDHYFEDVVSFRVKGDQLHIGFPVPELGIETVETHTRIDDY